MTGIICMWHGLLVDIPNGWALCDGTNGTPDLRGQFVRGAPDGIDPGGTGGTISHRHFTIASTGFFDTAHTHQVTGQTGLPLSGDDDTVDEDGDLEEYDNHHHPVDILSASSGSNHQHTVPFYTAWADHIPPYYHIAFIMKT